MSHRDRRKKRLPLSFSLLYALPVMAAAAPVVADAATSKATSSHATRAVHSKSVKKASVARTATTPRAGAPISGVTPTVVQSAPVASSTIKRARATDTADGGTESVLVTGSFLRQGRNTSPNPVQIISAKDIQQTGITNVGDFLQRMPSIGSSGRGNADTNGGAGISCTDLRNLGASRVLVLVDGKRLTQSGDSTSSCVDMNTIPVMAVQSIEILKDGGSELYGADAVSGVINIKLKHNINTGGVNLRGNITQRGDNRTGLISAYKGFNFDHDRGNITVMGQYDTQGGVMMKDRAWSRYPQANNPANPASVSYGSIISSKGTYFGSDTYNSNNQGSLIPYSKDNRYNYNKDSSLLNQTQNASLMGDAHYDFDKHFTLYSNVMYSHKTSWTQMAPMPAMGSVPPSSLPSAIMIPTDYPGNTSGEELQMYRRMSEFGNRKTETAIDSLTAKVGASGEIAAGWMYDASFTYGSTMASFQTSGVGDYAKLLREWGLDAATPGDSTSDMVYNPNSCVGYAGCVQSSALGALSPDAARYANYTEHDNSQYTMRDTNMRIHNDHVVKMPYKGGGDLGIALGMEHRSEQFSYHPDPLIQNGGSLTNTVAATGGGFNVSEAYIQGNLTLLKNVPFAKNLSIDGQGRYSTYNTFGSTYNWKAGINWAPTRDVAFRGTLGTSFRQPSVSEMYGGTVMSYNGANDPCDMTQVTTYGGRQASVVANCMNKANINTSTFQQSGSGQVATLVGGNAKLRPEVGRTYTFGATFTPHWIRGLSTSAEFWHYRVSDTISALSTQYVLDGCYTGSSPDMCNYVNRLGNGQINSVSALNANLGAMTTSGVDWDLSYRFRVSDADWFMVENNFQRLVSYKQQMIPGGPHYNFLGSITYQSQGTSNPTVRDYATLTWHHNNFSVTYMMQYMSGMHWNDGTYTIHKSDGYGRVKTPSMVMQDLTFNYNLKRWNFQFEIQNLTDKQPPFLVNTSSNSNDSTYSGWYAGRTFLLQAGMTF